MKYRRSARLIALPLALTLLLAPAARALTPDQARELLSTYYVDGVSQDVLQQPTIQDMLEALGDPYTEYFTAEEYHAFTSSMQDTQLVGIGVSSLVTEQGLLLQRVYADTPAEEAGLLAGDLLTAVDGRSVVGVDADTGSQWLQGEEGTQVSVTYLRDGQEHTVTLTRRAVTIPATYSELWDGNIGYIDCDAFGSETMGHFVEAMDGLTDAQHWIVDLRGNGGGDVNASMEAASCFTGPSVLAYLRDASGTYGAYGTNNDSRTVYPALVLTDGTTASASELFSAGIRDTNSGLVIGGRTYGKGVAQSVFDQSSNPDYFPDGDALKVTTYRFFARSGATTDTVGIIPHLLVDPAIAPEVATLLCATGSADGSTAGLLRLDFGWRWYVDLDTALSPEHRAAFVALLEALPATVRVLEGLGGSEQWADTTVSALVEKYGLSEYRSRGFSDSDESPYGRQIDLLATYGIVSGSGDGTFDPDGQLTRAQLSTLLAQALNCNVPTGESRFSDVAMDAWYGPSVNAIAKLGLVEGVGNGRFDPDAPVTHEQFITIMGRLSLYLSMYMDLSMQEMPETAASTVSLMPYAEWSRDAAWLLALSQQGMVGNSLNLLWALLEEIDPTAVTTREEAAVVTYTLFSYLGVLPV